jgi:5-methylcytosine-specific restriction endonuclease McrA
MPYKDPEKEKACKLAWAKKNADKVRASNEAYRKSNAAKIKAKLAAYYVKNRDRILARGKAYVEANPDKLRTYRQKWFKKNKAKRREYIRQHREKNPNAYHQYNKNREAERQAWAEKHRDKVRMSKRKWLRNNPGYWVIASNVRRRRLLNAGPPADPVAYASFIAWARTAKVIPCRYCGKKTRCGKNTRHIDHYIPLCRGGADDVHNLVVACPSCNSRKHKRMPEEFIALLEKSFPSPSDLTPRPLSAPPR